MKLAGLPDYAQLDLSGEAVAAAARMEARAADPASLRLFDALVRPLLVGAERILEVGCGTGALARRIAAACGAEVVATDKSEGMLQVAIALGGRVGFERWDVLEEGGPAGDFDLIVSSVMVPYLDSAVAERVVVTLAGRLADGGRLAFIEQDLQTDALHFPDFGLLRRVIAKDQRALRPHLALGLRALLRSAGLVLDPRASHLWATESFGPYLSDLLGAMARDAVAAGRIDEAEHVRWNATLAALADRGDFAYSLLYHRMSGVQHR